MYKRELELHSTKSSWPRLLNPTQPDFTVFTFSIIMNPSSATYASNVTEQAVVQATTEWDYENSGIELVVSLDTIFRVAKVCRTALAFHRTIRTLNEKILSSPLYKKNFAAVHHKVRYFPLQLSNYP